MPPPMQFSAAAPRRARTQWRGGEPSEADLEDVAGFVRFAAFLATAGDAHRELARRWDGVQAMHERARQLQMGVNTRNPFDPWLHSPAVQVLRS